MGESGTPEQLPGESDENYARFLRWCREIPVEATSGETGKVLGLTDAYVRRVWKKFRWKERRAPVDKATNDLATVKVMERVTDDIALKAAEAWTQSQHGHKFLAAETVSKAVQAMRTLDITQLDANGIVRFASSTLRDLTLKDSPSVSVTTDGSGKVSVEIEALRELPVAQRAERVKAIADETARKADVLKSYYDGKKSS